MMTFQHRYVFKTIFKYEYCPPSPECSHWPRATPSSSSSTTASGLGHQTSYTDQLSKMLYNSFQSLLLKSTRVGKEPSRLAEPHERAKRSRAEPKILNSRT